jgi:hypothetical protein
MRLPPDTTRHIPSAGDGTAASSRDRVLVPGRAHADGTEQGYANYVTIARFLNGLRWQESPSNVLDGGAFAEAPPSKPFLSVADKPHITVSEAPAVVLCYRSAVGRAAAVGHAFTWDRVALEKNVTPGSRNDLVP